MRDPHVAADLRQSNIYMIVSRAEGKFTNFHADPDHNSLSFEFTAGTALSDTCRIMVNKLPGVEGSVTDELQLELGEKGIRIWSTHPDRSRNELSQWFTTEKLLFDRWQGMPGLYGLDRLRDLTRYELLYVGISKTHDAFDRLLVQPHDKRLRVLANEPQKSQGARVTDETYLLFFRTDVLRVDRFDHESAVSDFDSIANPPDLRDPRIVSDAEKAFVHFIGGRYNTVRYKQYPRGIDGLFGSNLARYAYVVAEDITLCSPTGTIRGGFHRYLPNSNVADAIFVDGDSATLLRAEEMRPSPDR
jgi:hypothetical protein